MTDIKSELAKQKSLSIRWKLDVIITLIEYQKMSGILSNLNKQIRESLGAIEMWLLRQVMLIPQTTKVNSNCMEKAIESQTWYAVIIKGQRSYFDHIMRREAIKNTMTTGSISS